VLVRLIVPINISIPFGLTHSIRTVSETEISEITKRANFNADNFVFNNLDSKSLLSNRKELKPNENGIHSIVSFLWFSMVIFLAFGTVLWNLHIRRLVKQFLPVKRRDILVFFENKCREMNLTKINIEILCINENMPIGPTVGGLLNPKILLPYRIIEKWTVDDIEPVIVHELVHIKQRDLYINWVQIIVTILFFFNPFVWFANWKIRDVREQVCDDIAIKYSKNNRKRYSMSIINVIEIIFKEPVWAITNIGFSERKSSLAKRIIRISNEKYTFHKPLNLLSNILLVVTAIISLTLACDYAPEKIMGNNDLNAPVNVQKTLQVLTGESNDTHITILISETGDYQIEGVQTNSFDLKNTLSEAIKNTSKKNVLIVPKVQTPNQFIDLAIRTSIDLKLDNISIKPIEMEAK
jgi:beta-lactamase regulating signal transducer with metallopeptidase domain